MQWEKYSTILLPRGDAQAAVMSTGIMLVELFLLLACISVCYDVPLAQADMSKVDKGHMLR